MDSGAQAERELQPDEGAHITGDHLAVPITAARLGTDWISPAPSVPTGGRDVPARMAHGHNVAPASLASLPGLVLPAGSTDQGLAVAVEVNARAGGDEDLISLGFAVEAALLQLP